MIDMAIPRAMTLKEIQDATASDETLQQVTKLIKSGTWHTAAKDNTHRPHYNIPEELSLNPGENIVLRQTKIVLPSSLQQCAIDIAHVSHPAVVRLKSLLRSKVYFPAWIKRQRTRSNHLWRAKRPSSPLNTPAAPANVRPTTRSVGNIIIRF